MIERFNICGYTRISVDLHEDRDNTSIENQKAIIEDYVQRNFPESELDIYVDRDRSGYTFSQREQYQIMRKKLVAGEYDILIVKDLSRFSRRNGQGLVELEYLKDLGIRIIAINDSIDIPTNDDWLRAQIYFFVNEMPVTDTSKKVRSVIKHRQEEGKWVCTVPYGYIMTNHKTQAFCIDEPAALVIRKIFELYISGWGYKRIANWLTDQHIPTPNALTAERIRARGEEPKLKYREVWSVITVQEILENDFYIGTLRQRKYRRKKIHGADEKLNESEHIVFANHHEPIIDSRTFNLARQIHESRSKSAYRPPTKNKNLFSGYLVCGDCGSPMFAFTKRNMPTAYHCGEYHKRGLKGCTSHFIREDILVNIVKNYIRKVRSASDGMLDYLQKIIDEEANGENLSDEIVSTLEEQLENLQNELKVTKAQRVRDTIRHPENSALLDETYDEMESELINRIEGIKNQIIMSEGDKSLAVKAKAASIKVCAVFDEILNRDSLEREDLAQILDRITVYEDRIEVALRADIDGMLRTGAEIISFDPVNLLAEAIVQSAVHRPPKEFKVDIIEGEKSANLIHDISGGDPLEIFTDKDGEVIFKKYSPIGELGDFAAQICDSLHKSTDSIAAVCDRDSIIAVAGGAKRELLDRMISEELEKIMEKRGAYRQERACTVPVTDSDERYCVSVAAPVIAEGDLMGCVLFVAQRNAAPASELEYKLAQTVASFIGKQMES